jgi:hypothetical protein
VVRLSVDGDAVASLDIGSVHEFEVTYEDGDVHRLSDELRELDCTVRTFETITPDLRDVFLKITTDDTVTTDE